MWILILTAFGGYYGSSPAVTTVPGFSTWQECSTAGQAWYNTVYAFNGNASPKFNCVYQSKK